MANPEKLNLWDRFFNRYRKTIHKQGTQTWFFEMYGVRIQGSEYSRSFVDYLVVDRLTGSEYIKRKYLT